MGINVLSLFDGMSCGQIALDRLGIAVDNYFASEINQSSIKVTQDNYPNTIQLGDVKQVKGTKLPKIDLLLAGSPCQGFSVSGKQLNFADSRSELFFEFVRILRECKPKYFLLENVNMKREYQILISQALVVEPIRLNSSLVSAQNRDRLYWTNIPYLKPPEDKQIVIQDILDTNTNNYVYIPESRIQNRVYKPNYLQYDINGRGHNSQDQRAFYLQGKHGCLMVRGDRSKILDSVVGRVRKTTRLECERLQTVPDNYTRAVNQSKAKQMLGNGWTVGIVVHLLKGMPFIKSSIFTEAIPALNF